jgi:glycosyltransferase involved in cell wall biosynthesis
LNNFKPEIAKKTVESKKNVVIGCIGRHEPEKGTLFVLRAFEKLHKKDSRFFLRIAYGNLPEAWEHEHSEIIEPKNDQELADFYRSLDILVAPGTLQHGAPHYPVLEAAACGVAVVTTGYLGATQETAWIVKNKSVDAIVKSIVDIIHNDDLRVEKAKKFMNEIKCYSWEKVSTKMLKYF